MFKEYVLSDDLIGRSNTVESAPSKSWIALKAGRIALRVMENAIGDDNQSRAYLFYLLIHVWHRFEHFIHDVVELLTQQLDKVGLYRELSAEINFTENDTLQFAFDQRQLFGVSACRFVQDFFGAARERVVVDQHRQGTQRFR